MLALKTLNRRGQSSPHHLGVRRAGDNARVHLDLFGPGIVLSKVDIKFEFVVPDLEVVRVFPLTNPGCFGVSLHP